jgi:putative oxidoreductase
MGIGRLIARVIVGTLFAGHGLQKLAGWFGGGGPDKTAQMFDSIGLRPGRQHALAAGQAELGGGILLALGLATPAAVSLLTGVMASAVRHVHAKNGVWNTNGGVELHAFVVAGLLALAEAGPGPLSLDAVLGTELEGTAVALGAVGAGIAGSLAISELARRQAALADSDAPLSAEAETVAT